MTLSPIGTTQVELLAQSTALSPGSLSETVPSSPGPATAVTVAVGVAAKPAVSVSGEAAGNVHGLASPLHVPPDQALSS